MIRSKEFLDLIKVLRFPLCVMVLLIHSHFGGLKGFGGVEYQFDDLVSYPVYSNISFLISELLCRVSVPIFFIFSGYLFFCKSDKFTIQDYIVKLKSRAKSLLLPFIFWNLVFIFMLYLKQSIIGIGEHKLVVDYTLNDWILSFVDKDSSGLPINTPLWFVRDLIVMVLISPIIYRIISNTKWYSICLFGLLWVLFYDDIKVYLNLSSIFFFSLGAYFSIQRQDIVRVLEKVKNYNYVVSVLLLLFEMIYFNFKEYFGLHLMLSQFIYNACVFTLIVSCLNISLTILRKKGCFINDFLCSSNFFIYVFHRFPLAVLLILLISFIDPTSDIQALMIYFLAPTIILAVGVSVYVLLRKLLPKFTALITGGR